MEKKSDLKIVFMGTPEFAVPSLDILVRNNFNIVGVVTAPDRPAGRGMHLNESAVKKYAAEKNIFLLQPEKLKAPEFAEQLKTLQPDLMIVVAFRMLPEVIWKMPRIGTFNLHASLLPHYRGAAPINWAIINGERETGVTTFFLEHEIDTGNILLQNEIPIGEEETAGELHDRMKAVGAELVLETVELILKGDYSPTKQNTSTELKHATKIFTETQRINWNDSSEKNHNLIRGLSPYPGAFTMLNGKMLKIFSCRKLADSDSLKFAIHHSPFTIYSDGKTFLHFQCADGALDILELQLEGKKRMTVEEFLRGNKI